MAFWQLSTFGGLMLLLGFVLGFIVHDMASQTKSIPQPITVVAQETVLHLQTIENGKLIGNLQGAPVRLRIGDDEILESLHEGDFTANLVPILPMLKKIPHPDSAQYVASKRGKYYWALDSVEAAQITWKNRVFFGSREEAEEQGFVRK